MKFPHIIIQKPNSSQKFLKYASDGTLKKKKNENHLNKQINRADLQFFPHTGYCVNSGTQNMIVLFFG